MCLSSSLARGITSSTGDRHSVEVVKVLGYRNDVFLQRDELLDIGCWRKARHALTDAPTEDFGAYGNNHPYRLKARN